jgi:pantoate--beta-alanine ligase
MNPISHAPASLNVYRSLRAWQQARMTPDLPDQSIGFVPTMGALHAGHRVLLEKAWRENDRVVLSIFANPTQFNDPADFQAYPSTLEADLNVARGLATDVLVPSAAEIYPDGYEFRVGETNLSQELEGRHRPGHFEGMLTVVLKLLNLVQPDRAYFGEKDWQQLQLVQGMVRAFFLPCSIVACPTVRDDDGLALSSRNGRLSPEGRLQAQHFPRILRAAPDPATAALELGLAGFQVDYVEDRDGRRLGAVRLEGVRLIDNVPL